MIPKIIHYCWFGRNPLPETALNCIASWKKYLSGYEIKEWNEDNFDVNIIPYTAEAYKARKYAFVSDFARFWVLNKYGGVYFDTDVEVIKPMNSIIEKGAFMGAEHDVTDGSVTIKVAPGLGMASMPNDSLLLELLAYYENYGIETTYELGQVETVVDKTTKLLIKYGLENTNQIQMVCGYYIYPKTYFCPMDYETGKISITPNTYSIHHYSGTWLSLKGKIRIRIKRFLGEKIVALVRKIKNYQKN